MNVTIGKIPPNAAGELSSQPAGENRKRSTPRPAAPAVDRRIAPDAEAADLRSSALEELRARLLLLQRDVARAQRVLGGLEGVGALLEARSGIESPRQTVERYVEGVRYRGEGVLLPLAEQLERIVREGDSRALQGLVEESRARLGRLAQELSRYETAQQNSRALAAADDPLQSLKADIRKAGGPLLGVHRENVLRLLG